MAYAFKTRIDMTDMLADLTKLYGKGWPKMLAHYIADMADDAEQAGELRTRQEFDLHSEYIPRGIKSTPSTPAQIKKVEKSLSKYYDGFGAVYLRGSSDPKRSLGFMVDHEVGFKRDPQSVWRSANGDKYIAQPAEGIKSKAYRTQTGRIKKRWRPSTLLEHFDRSGSRYEHGTTKTNKYPNRSNKARLPGKAFVIKGKSGRPVVARSISRGSKSSGGKLEILYTLHREARINPVWRFEDTVISAAKRTQKRTAIYNSNKLAGRFK